MSGEAVTLRTGAQVYRVVMDTTLLAIQMQLIRGHQTALAELYRHCQKPGEYHITEAAVIAQLGDLVSEMAAGRAVVHDDTCQVVLSTLILQDDGSISWQHPVAPE